MEFSGDGKWILGKNDLPEILALPYSFIARREGEVSGLPEEPFKHLSGALLLDKYLVY